MRRLAEALAVLDFLGTLVGLAWWATGRLPDSPAGLLAELQVAGGLVLCLAVPAVLALTVVALRPQFTEPWHRQ
jgi:hypothetical protein